MDKTLRVVIIGFIAFITFTALVIGVVLMVISSNGNGTTNYTGPGIIAFIIVLLGVFGLIAGIITALMRR